LGVRRERRCLVSNSLLRDLEPARQLGVPTIWMRHPKSLAGDVASVEYSSPWTICADFDHLVFSILKEKEIHSAAIERWGAGRQGRVGGKLDA
jgi:FMN phosphatase YigB (HAD superfamily)